MKQIFYTVKKINDNIFNIVKCTAEAEYTYWQAKDRTQHSIIAICPSKFIADYVVSAFEFLWINKNIDAEDYAEVLENYRLIDIDELAFKYCIDTIGNCVALHNAYKLINDKVIEMWLAGSMRFGVLSLDKINETEIKAKLKNAIESCIKTYLHSA